MKTYTITLLVDNEEKTSNWSHYNEQGAIAQCFLSEAQQGARNLEVLSIILK